MKVQGFPPKKAGLKVLVLSLDPRIVFENFTQHLPRFTVATDADIEDQCFDRKVICPSQKPEAVEILDNLDWGNHL